MRPVSAFAKVGIFALIAGAVAAVGAVWWLPDWLPPDAATEAHREDTLFLWLLVTAAIIFSVVVSFLGYSMWKFRARPGDMSDGAPIHGHTGLEIIWTIIPIIIVLSFAVAGTIVLNRDESLTKGHLVVNVTGRQFAWSFTYPKYGHLHTGVLALPAGRQVEFRLHAPRHGRDPRLQDPRVPHRGGRGSRARRRRWTRRPTGWAPTRSSARSCAASATARCAPSRWS